MGKLNKRSFRYTRIWYTPWLVNFDRFCQHSSITDADELYDIAAVRDFSTSNAVFKSVINNNKLKRFPQVKCLRDEQKDCIKIRSMKDSFAILPTGFWKNLIYQLFPRVMSDEWRSRRCLHDHDGLSSSRGHNESNLNSWTQSESQQGNGYRLRNREEPESARLCVKICK